MQMLPFACHACHSPLFHVVGSSYWLTQQRNMSHLCCSVDDLRHDEVFRSVYRSSCFRKLAIVFLCQFFGRRRRVGVDADPPISFPSGAHVSQKLPFLAIPTDFRKTTSVFFLQVHSKDELPTESWYERSIEVTYCLLIEQFEERR